MLRPFLLALLKPSTCFWGTGANGRAAPRSSRGLLNSQPSPSGDQGHRTPSVHAWFPCQLLAGFTLETACAKLENLMLSRRVPARLSARGGLTKPRCQHLALQISSQRLHTDGVRSFWGVQGTAGTWQRRPELAAGTRSNAGSGNLSLDLLPQLLAFLLLRLLLYSNQGLMSKITTANAARCSSVLSADLYHPAAITSLPGARGLGFK